jgi:predicted MFS family arabinose efflux permease
VHLSQSTRVGIAGLLALVATFGLGRLSYGLFVPTFRQEFGLPLDVLGFYAGAAQAGYLVAAVVAAVLAGLFGPRVPVVSGGLLLAAGATVVATAPGPILLAVGVIAAGTSAGGTWGPFSDEVEATVPPSRRRRALALVNIGSPIGLLVASVCVLLVGDRWRAVWLLFAVVGLVAAAVSWKVLAPARSRPARDRERRGLTWFVTLSSARLFVVAAGASITSGAYFAYAPDTAQSAGLPEWIGPAMWVVLGIAGAAVGAFGGGLAERYGLRGPLAVMLVLISTSMLLLVGTPGTLPVALGSAALFGVGFTTSFALLVMWSQQVFHDRPTAGFTVVIVFAAAGFVVGPSMFGVFATYDDRTTALVISAAPALLVALVPSASLTRSAPRGARS